MSSPKEQLARLRRFNASVARGDAEIAEESAELRGELEVLVSPQSVEQGVELESIVLRRERPVLSILRNETALVFVEEADSTVWKKRLEDAKSFLDRAIPAVGRIELSGGSLDWVGTGWLVADGILVTNRHVANEFAARKGAGFDFKIGSAGRIAAAVDFLQEIDNPATLVFDIIKPLHIEASPGPDIAFFEVELVRGDARLAKPIDLAAAIAQTESVATIGYPAYDSRIPEPDLMERIYGRIYNKKRLAPGAITRVDDTRILHNCTTLGGNSGSAVVDLRNGEALGLHFSGTFLSANYAVRADVVKKLLERVRSGRTRPEMKSRRTLTVRPGSAQSGAARSGAARAFQTGSATVTIPLHVTVSLGPPAWPAAARGYPPSAFADEDDAGSGEEAKPADYRDRKGYLPAFLGEGSEVDLPLVERDAEDVLKFEFDGSVETELRYAHFSVVMSESRRMCFFSAVNINGATSKKTRRVGWKWDPRLPQSRQIMKECYGDPPRFSRGHMTRREDPAWGTTNEAKRGNEDSMHVTNTTPQMQAFNSPIWLALEDYALEHAREDDMKISVFTGPYFANADPEMYGVRIPVAFWKVIAFIHDETGELCATGYEMNQERNLQPEEEFVFGQFVSPQLNTAAQVTIRSIEERAGISFGGLADVDPFEGHTESRGGPEGPAPLQRFEQIRFVR